MLKAYEFNGVEYEFNFERFASESPLNGTICTTKFQSHAALTAFIGCVR